MKQLRKILIFTLIGLGSAGLGYGVWQHYRDQQILQQVKVQERAIVQYRQATQQHPKDPQAFLRLGNAAMAFWEKSRPAIRISLRSGGWEATNWLMANPLQEAIAAYTTALKLDPSLAEAQTGLCRAMVEQNKQSQAAAVTAACRHALTLNPQAADSYLSLGVALSRQNQWSEAEAMFRRYLSLTTDKGNAYYQIGKSLLAQRKYKQAVLAYQQAIRFSPQSNLSYEGLGDALIEQNQPEAAIAAYRKSLAVEPNYPIAYVKLGDLLLEKQQFAEAVSTYRQLVERYPSLSSGYAGLGRGLAAQQQWDQALAAYNQAIELDDQNSWAFQDRGDMFANQNRLDQAIADYSKALQLDPTNIFALIDRGIVYARQGQPKSALLDFKRAVQLEPNSATSLNALCWNGSLIGEAAQIISACEKAIAIANPQDKDLYRDSRGLARAMTGNQSGAIADFQAFLQWTTSDAAKAYTNQQDLQKRANRRRDWIQALQNNQNPFTLDLRQELLTE